MLGHTLKMQGSRGCCTGRCFFIFSMCDIPFLTPALPVVAIPGQAAAKQPRTDAPNLGAIIAAAQAAQAAQA